MVTRNLTDLLSLSTFEERFEYLKLKSKIGIDTFGFDRYLNQAFYASKEWKRIRDLVIIRDNGCDLAIPDRTIYGKILIHHIEPITKDDVINRDPKIMDLDNLISVSFETHNAIHYGDINLLPTIAKERKPNDTCPWKSCYN